jgi:UDP-N-acetylmuramoyl-tripeptide--D-alanyl-D-alanine ligase
MKLTRTDLRSVPHLALHVPQGRERWSATGVSTDSRTVAPGQLYVALRGEKFDGHAYVADVLARGAAGVVVDAKGAAGLPADAVALVVEDTYAALRHLAAVVRKKFTGPVIAVGGSNGKTTTKDMIARVLGTTKNVLCTEGNNNNHVGVPQTLFRLEKQHDVAVVEVGTNHPGEVALLRDVLQPTHVLITNVGREHLEFFGSVEGVAAEETTLWTKVPGGKDPVAFVNTDDALLMQAARGRKKCVRYGTKLRSADVRASRIRLTPEGGVQFTLAGKGIRKPVEIALHVPGEHAAINALAAAAVGLALRVPVKKIAEALGSFTASSKRMEVAHVNGVAILNDTYNANPDSTMAALRTLAAYPVSGKRIAVLADMLELGAAAEAEHECIGQAAASMKIGYVLTYGTLGKIIARAAAVPTAVHYDQKNILAEYLLELLSPGDVVLVKGSRGMRMEDVVTFLLERGAAAERRKNEVTI